LNKTYLNRPLTLAFAAALAAMQLSAALADGGSAGSAAAGGVNQKGSGATSSPRASVDAEAKSGSSALPAPAKIAKRTSMGGAPSLAGSGNSGSANARKSDSTSSQ
jgi:hypothetical protein